MKLGLCRISQSRSSPIFHLAYRYCINLNLRPNRSAAIQRKCRRCTTPRRWNSCLVWLRNK